MKKYFIYLIISLFLFFENFAQKKFEGMIEFSIKTKNQKTKMVYSLKNDWKKIEIENLNAFTIVRDKKSILLMPDTKKYMVLDEESSKMQNPLDLGKDKKLNKTGRSKEILGYTCAEYSLEDEEQIVILWATEEFIKFPGFSGEGDEIGPYLGKEKFFPFLIIVEVFGNKMEMEITEINPNALENSVFEIPEDYTEVNLPGRK